VTIASRPFGWDETVIDMPVIWGEAEPKYFLLWDSTAQITQNIARRADQSAGSARGPAWPRRYRRRVRVENAGALSASLIFPFHKSSERAYSGV
jgi:hypothetical protein